MMAMKSEKGRHSAHQSRISLKLTGANILPEHVLHVDSINGGSREQQTHHSSQGSTTTTSDKEPLLDIEETGDSLEQEEELNDEEEEVIKLRIDSIEAEKIYHVMMNTIRKVEVITLLTYIAKNIDKYKQIMGSTLCNAIMQNTSLERTIKEAVKKAEAINVEKKKLRDNLGGVVGEEYELYSPSETNIVKDVDTLQHQLKKSCTTVLHLFKNNQAAMDEIIEDARRCRANPRQPGAIHLIQSLEELKNILLEKINISHTQKTQKDNELNKVNARTQKNYLIANEMERTLHNMVNTMDDKVASRDDIIRKLQFKIFCIDKRAEDYIIGIDEEAAKQTLKTRKRYTVSEPQTKHQLNKIRQKYQEALLNNADSEELLRKKKWKVETEVENWTQKYDQDMQEKQDEMDKIKNAYDIEKKQLEELEKKFEDINKTYSALMEERRITQEESIMQKQLMHRLHYAAKKIQRAWREYRFRKKQLKKKARLRKKRGRSKSPKGRQRNRTRSPRGRSRSPNARKKGKAKQP